MAKTKNKRRLGWVVRTANITPDERENPSSVKRDRFTDRLKKSRPSRSEARRVAEEYNNNPANITAGKLARVYPYGQ